MRKFVEKSIIAFFSLYATYIDSLNIDLAYYFLISIVFSIILDLIVEKKYRHVIYTLFALLVFYDSNFLFYFPLILYNIYIDFKFYSIIFFLLFFTRSFPIVLILSIIALYLSQSTEKIDTILKENRNIRDELKEDTLYLRKYNEQLKLDKEKNIHIAILTERNRIAREIHDSVGHTISSSILQVNALKVISPDRLKQPLNLLQKTLSNGMDDIRKSLQGLRDESFDLKSKIEDLIEEVPNLDIKFTYNIEDDIEYNLKFDILSVIKEAITNSLKHSNATRLKISLFSQPKFYSISIVDNGDKKPLFENKGIGLDYINETANKHSGYFNYSYEDGFKIYLTLMKGE